MAEEKEKIQPLDLIGNKKVTVEIGIGHRPGWSALERLEQTTDIETGAQIHVSIDEEPENLKHVALGSVSAMTMHDFACGDFLDGKVSHMYIFNVFGEPFSTASVAGFDEQLFTGLGKKLRPGGNIVIGEHITPKAATFVRDVKRLESLDLKVDLYTSPVAIEAKLKAIGFSERYARTFVGQSEENKLRYGPEHAGFLVILTK